MNVLGVLSYENIELVVSFQLLSILDISVVLNFIIIVAIADTFSYKNDFINVMYDIAERTICNEKCKRCIAQVFKQHSIHGFTTEKVAIDV